MTDTERIELIRAIIFKGGKISPAAIIEAIKPIVGEPPAPVAVPEQETQARGKVTALPVKGQEASQQPTVDCFLRTRQIAKLLDIKPRTLIEYRTKGRLTLPLIRKDGMLGCFESTYREWQERVDNRKLA